MSSNNPFDPNPFSDPLDEEGNFPTAGNPASIVAEVSPVVGAPRNISGYASLSRNDIPIFVDQPITKDAQGIFRYPVMGAQIAQKGIYQYALKFIDANSGDISYVTGSFEV